jgi:hypothetical protein
MSCKLPPYQIKLAKKLGTDISSRRSGNILRHEIAISVLKGLTPVEIDFEHVACVSDCFLDELFGIMARNFGTKWFRDNIRITGISPEDRVFLLRVIRRRLDEQLDPRLIWPIPE